jgi:hypothetical protein
MNAIIVIKGEFRRSGNKMKVKITKNADASAIVANTSRIRINRFVVVDIFES